MRYMSKLKQQITQKNQSRGFTLVEILVIAPILILMISGFIVLIVSITGDVLKSNAGNQAAYSTQSAIDTFEQDARLATQFLTSSTTLLSPQGTTGGNAPFNGSGQFQLDNPSGTSRNVVAIMSTSATSKNPLDPTRELIYNRGTLADCNTPANAYKQNDPYAINIIYFYTEENGSKTLWRRVVFNDTYNANNVCGGAIWQRRSCTPGMTNPVCGADDVKVLTNIDTIDVRYFRDFGFTTEASYASIPVDGVGVELNITVNQKVAGVDVKRSGLIRATRVGSIVAPTTPAVIVSHPSNVFTTAGRTAIFSVTPSDATSTVQWQYSTNSGGSWANLNGATNTSLSIPDVKQAWTDRKYRAVVTNPGGSTITSNAATLSVGLWGQLPLSNGYSFYGSTFAPPGFTKTTAGVVMLKGLVQRAGSLAATPNDTVIGVLPEGMRPPAHLLFQTSTHPQTAARIDVYPDGTVRAVYGNDGWLALDGIKFIPSPSPTTFNATHPVTNITFTNATFTAANGWSNYAAPWQGLQFGRDNVGRVHTRGLITNGVITDNTQILSNMTATNLVPNEYLTLPAFAYDVGIGERYGSIGIRSTLEATTVRGLVARGKGKGYLQANTMFYPAAPSPTATWTNLGLLNGWAQYPGAFSMAQYTKGSDNVVTVKGLIRNGPVGSQIAQLPLCYRPKETIIVSSASWTSSEVHGRIDIASDGRIVSVGGGNVWLAMDNINFVADGDC